jgi:hypothetical protein
LCGPLKNRRTIELISPLLHFLDSTTGTIPVWLMNSR